MSEGNGGGGQQPPQQLSYLERMKRLRARNEEKRAREGFGTTAAAGGVNYAKSTVSNPTIATSAAEEKENAVSTGARSSSNYDNDASLLQESMQHRANKSAPAGDVSSMLLSTTSIGGGAGGGCGDELQRSTFSLLGDNSCVGGGGSLSNDASRNTSGGSSVIDVPRDASSNRLHHHNSILNSFIAKEEEQPSKLESFSRPSVPAPRSRADSAGEARGGGADETFDIKPPPPEPQPFSAARQHHYIPQQQPQQQQQQYLPQQNHSMHQQQERQARSAAANGSILRSKSSGANAFEPPVFATPAISRSNAILGGLMPRTPGFCQTPSMYRLSTSALSLASAQRMIIKDREYAILSQIGKGGSSQVYQAFDDQTNETVAIKVVDLSDTDEASREAFINEVELLKTLQGSRHVIRMFDYEIVPEDDQLLVVMEKGETDLATFLKTRRTDLTSAFIRYWWEAMLQAVKFVHEHNIVHMDLKPANFLLVSGNLKLIDFGIASSIPTDKTSLLKDTQMGTLSYMSPESLLAAELAEEGDEEKASKFKVTAKADVWSLGCILYTMVYGRRPFDQFKNQRAKMRAISDPNTQIYYEPTQDPIIVDVLKRCLVFDVKRRASVTELLEHPYLKAPTTACSLGRGGAAAATVCTPTRGGDSDSPISDEAITQMAHKMQSYTPNTMARELRKLVVTAQSKRPPPGPKLELDLDSPPSTK